MNFVDSFDFLAEAKGVACRKTNASVTAGIVYSVILVKVLSFETGCLVYPAFAEDIYGCDADVPVFISPAEFKLI